ncbi:MAG: hypothetical protein LC795_23445 [Acidobacteria bacterium]|nr:hypothetical protein [Acidobacteriota bacterium]
MQNPFQENLRKPWLLLCTSLLVVYSIMPVERETLFFSGAPSSFIEALMFLLSFPLGAAAASLFHSPDFGVTGRFAFWAAAMGGGYLQWFHLFPALLRRLPARPTTVTLNLSMGSGVAPRAAHVSAATRPLGLSEAARPPVPQFNDRGLTPLERVFRDEE